MFFCIVFIIFVTVFSRIPSVTVRTVLLLPRVHVEQAPRRREAVAVPGRRRRAVRRCGEVGPAALGGVVGVEVVEVACCVCVCVRARARVRVRVS